MPSMFLVFRLGKYLQDVLQVLPGIAGWLLVAPVARLMPRRKDWLAVIGRDEGKFIDNTKHFLLQSVPLLKDQVRVVFVTERSDLVDLVAGCGYEAMRYPTWRSVWFLLRAGTLVVDSVEWHLRLRRFLTIGCRRVQLWHGVGFKRIELEKWSREMAGRAWMSRPIFRGLRVVRRALVGRHIRYDLINTTSRHYRDLVFAPAMRSHHFSVLGYPRNAFEKFERASQPAAWCNVDTRIADAIPVWQNEGRRIVLVAPTFRDTRASPMGLDAATVFMLDDWCDRNNVELVFKFHPLERQAGEVKGRHLHLCQPDSDFYPLMPLSSAMVSDYSSICIDYLLLDKPIAYLVPDLDQYSRVDRQLQFDFNDMSPGPKATTWVMLVEQLEAEWKHDAYVEARAALRTLAFDNLPQNQAAPRIIALMRELGWLPS